MPSLNVFVKLNSLRLPIRVKSYSWWKETRTLWIFQTSWSGVHSLRREQSCERMRKIRSRERGWGKRKMDPFIFTPSHVSCFDHLSPLLPIFCSPLARLLDLPNWKIERKPLLRRLGSIAIVIKWSAYCAQFSSGVGGGQNLPRASHKP